ncbi:YfcC family protein [Trinickia dinghuensis]|uniref:YfcC family protein n=1 Tax=Trinickia dinghuensis TaxID=2291023 RepID=A0A3D8K1Z6_9BURK|nr:YfcC family protein [Trinickia dinghuensis]RDU98894.1 YfcC family protein [Trinickia dinghuensis]
MNDQKLAAAKAEPGSIGEHRSTPASTTRDSINPYVLLFFMLIAAAVATWLAPAGEFTRTIANGVSFVVPNSLKGMPQRGVLPGFVFVALARGMIKSAPIIFLILFTGGALAVIEATGAIRCTLNAIVKRDLSSRITTIVIVCAVFSFLGTLGVVNNSVVAFVPIGLLLAESMGLSREIGAGVIYLGTYSGFNTAILNPVTTGLSQRLAGLPMFSGMSFRIAVYLVFALATAVFLAIRTRAYRVSGEAQIGRHRIDEAAPSSSERLSVRHLLVVGILLVCLSVFVYGASSSHWAETEMIATFLVVAVASGIVGGIAPSKLADTFLSGCARLIHGALIVGAAQAVSIVLSSGKIIDPVINALAGMLAPLSPTFAAIGMFVSAALMHVGISSGSGESAVLVPIFAPLGDALHLTRQVSVQAVLLGEGFVNCFNPTSGVLMAVLATAGIPYSRWVRFVAPLLLVWFVICVVAIAIGVAIHWGPF